MNSVHWNGSNVKLYNCCIWHCHSKSICQDIVPVPYAINLLCIVYGLGFYELLKWINDQKLVLNAF